ncbi:MAG: tyrosine/phenylalanine carboxypeptidase domain-containing protein, partial [Allomuricauda sp.]
MIGTQEIKRLEKEYSSLFEIDANLDRLVRRIELLSYINPLNIEKEKQRFFASKFTSNPNFKYPKLKFDPYKLHRLFFSQRLERIKDERIRQLYQEVIYHYSNMIQCIETIGKSKKF